MRVIGRTKPEKAEDKKETKSLAEQINGKDGKKDSK